jgi:hypothetical protein
VPSTGNWSCKGKIRKKEKEVHLFLYVTTRSKRIMRPMSTSRSRGGNSSLHDTIPLQFKMAPLSAFPVYTVKNFDRKTKKESVPARHWKNPIRQQNLPSVTPSRHQLKFSSLNYIKRLLSNPTSLVPLFPFSFVSSTCSHSRSPLHLYTDTHTCQHWHVPYPHTSSIYTSLLKVTPCYPSWVIEMLSIPPFSFPL